MVDEKLLIEGAHLSHCNHGEYKGSCKYGEDDTCPAMIAAHERTARLHFHADIARAGLHDAAKDILAAMVEGQIPEPSICVITGGCQFLAELYEEVAEQTGADKAQMREHMVSSVGIYFDTYAAMTEKAKLGDGAVQ